jgi:hypothetical protein
MNHSHVRSHHSITFLPERLQLHHLLRFCAFSAPSSFIPWTDKLHPRYLDVETRSIVSPFIIIIFAAYLSFLPYTVINFVIIVEILL